MLECQASFILIIKIIFNFQSTKIQLLLILYVDTQQGISSIQNIFLLHKISIVPIFIAIEKLRNAIFIWDNHFQKFIYK